MLEIISNNNSVNIVVSFPNIIFHTFDVYFEAKLYFVFVHDEFRQTAEGFANIERKRGLVKPVDPLRQKIDWRERKMEIEEENKVRKRQKRTNTKNKKEERRKNLVAEK